MSRDAEPVLDRLFHEANQLDQEGRFPEAI